MTLLNTRSLRKHLDDKLSENYLLCNDIIDLPETVRRENTVDLMLKSGNHFRVHFNYKVQNHRCTGIAYSNRMQLLDSEDRDGMTIENSSTIQVFKVTNECLFGAVLSAG